MTLQLNRGTLQKLTHESTEIRLRTLEQVEAKLLRALAHDEAIDFKPGDLCKQLIRWFGFHPLQAPHKVLELLLRILRSQYGKTAVEQLRLERFIREMGKVELLVKKRPDELQLVAEIQQLLQSQRRPRSDDVIDMLNDLSLSNIGSVRESEYIECPPVDYEVPWSKAIVPDFNTMKFMADALVNPDSSDVDLQNTLQHLQICMSDYPSEYLLQAPNIYMQLLQLFDKADELKCVSDVAVTLLICLECIKTRLQLRRKTLSYAAPLKDATSLGKTQLKIEKAMQLLLERTLKQLATFMWEQRQETNHLLQLLTPILQVYNMQHLLVPPTNLQTLFELCAQLQTHCQTAEHFTSHRNKWLLLSLQLQDMIAHNAKQTTSSPIDTQLLIPLLEDYPFKMYYSKRFKQTQHLLHAIDKKLLQRTTILGQYENAFATAMQLLKSPKVLTSAQIITESSNLCLTLQQLQSRQLLKLLFDAIKDCLPLYPANEELRSQASSLLVQLLQQTPSFQQSYIYNRLAQAIKQHFASLMEGGTFCPTIPNEQLLSCLIVGVPLSADLLLQLVQVCCEPHDIISNIQQNAEIAITLLLQARHLLASHWCRLLDLLLPVLPLLQCCSESAKIQKLLLQLYDPDAKQVPHDYLLRGNIGLLFKRDAPTRCEALTRLIYMLNKLKNADAYVPNIMEISDLIPSDICLLQAPREYARIFSNSQLYAEETNTMQNLLILLETPDIEPLIRKTTLMQLNVLCQNWQLTEHFCQESAYYLIMQTLEQAMQTSSYADYTDAVIPAVSILAKVLCYDAALRQELADMPNIYVLLLRVLWLYPNDIQVRQDASICLCLLLFASYVVVLPALGKIQAPQPLENLQLPLKLEYVSLATSKTAQLPAYTTLFSSVDQANSYLRQHLACSYADGHTKLTNQYLDEISQLDIAPELHYTLRDWRLLQATSPAHNYKHYQQRLENATDQQHALQACRALELQLLAQQHECVPSAPETLGAELYKAMSKYLQLPPGNTSDFTLFNQLLELALICVQLPLQTFVDAFTVALHMDWQYACLTMLYNEDVPLAQYRLLCQLLSVLFHADAHIPAHIDASLLYEDLFSQLLQQATFFYEKRELQRVRCLLSIMQSLASHPLHSSDSQLLHHCKRMLQLAIGLKCLTQTGAQWQRDCLLIVCQLQLQMDVPAWNFTLNASLVKYLSGLCGHNDAQVRALAWCILAQVAQFQTPEEKNAGAELLLRELEYLPGGYLACCLSTFLDSAEVQLVRQLAGCLYVQLLQDFDVGFMLHEQHGLLRVAYKALSSCVLERMLPLHYDLTQSEGLLSCELVSVFCQICLKMLQLRDTYIADLCSTPFMYKLYELLKAPPAHDNPGYYVMCADICQLYALCYKEQFVFLQRTLCRDQVWLMSCYQLLDQPAAEEGQLVCILQLLLVLLKDSNAYGQFCVMCSKAPEFIVKLSLRALDVPHVETNLQRCTLAVLMLLLIKSQQELIVEEQEQANFAEILEATVSIEMSTDRASKEKKSYEKIKQLQYRQIKERPQTARSQVKKLEGPKNLHAILCENLRRLRGQQPKKRPLADDTSTPAISSNVGAVYIYMALERLFTHVYSLQLCKFETAPTATQQQICETFAVLLKVSPSAQQTAEELKLLNQVLRIFHSFFEQFNSTCTTFVRRHGEARKMAIIRHFHLLYSLILNWFAAPQVVLANETQALALTKVLIQTWPWLAHAADLKLCVLQVCAHLSERSLIVCQQFASIISGYAHSVLQLTLQFVNHETSSVKAASTEHFPVVVVGMRVLMNCCACTEGRISLIKSHSLDVFDGLYPFNLKMPKAKQEILHAWLQFWELFTRYSEGANVRNLAALCAVVNRSTPRTKTRLYALKILRNMSFLVSNRTTLINSSDFIFTINEIITQQIPLDLIAFDEKDNYSFEEQMIVCVAVWKLISAGVKFVAMLRGTKLAKRIRLLSEQLNALEQRDVEQFRQLPFAQDLKSVLDIIVQIFSNN